ncbi:MAG: RnfABCDGE type electron transport complex subunit D [Oscillospiraceae bacterium]|nr:RnfABCDGE type electron transport complex subunit D [Oscillospiraceae bacterium]
MAKTADKKAQSHFFIALLMLMLPTVMAWYYYRGDALRQIVTCAAAAFICELAVRFVFRKTLKFSFDYGSLFTGAFIALCLPADASLTLSLCAVFFAVLVAALPFGGFQHAPFIPAAAGLAFVCLCFPEEFFTYPPVVLPQSESIIAQGDSLALLLQTGGISRLETISLLEIINGNISGPMGAGSLPLIFGTIFFTLLLGKEAFASSAGFAAGMTAMAALFPRVTTGMTHSILLELSAGAALLCGICLIHSPANRPKHWGWCLGYGIYTAIAVMCYRYFGVHEEGVWFAVLFANGTWGILEGAFTKLINHTKSGNNGEILPPVQEEAAQG